MTPNEIQEFRELHNQLERMPPLDRLVALAVSVIDHDPRARQAVLALVWLVEVMCRHLSEADRAAVAVALTDAARALSASARLQ